MHRTFQMTIFIAIMSVVVGLVHFYLWRRLVKDTQLRGPLKTVLTVLTVLLGVSLPIGMWLSRAVDPTLARSLLILPFLWMGSMMLLFVATAASDILKGSALLARKAIRKPLNPSRRLFLSRLAAGGAVLTAGSLAGAAVVRGKASPVVNKRTVRLARFPSVANGFKIVQLTDLHIGSTLDMRWLEDVVQRTNALKPDLVVITGDLVDGDADRLGMELTPLRSLRSRQGVYFVTGNHEYYSGVAAWIPVIESMNIKVLRNEHIVIEDCFALLGVDDYNASRMAPGHGPDLSKAVKGVPKEMETVLLAHQPREIFRASKNNIGLVLSGHTHGGQIWPVNYFVGLQQPYNKGLFTHPGGRTQIYVSQGTGFWGPPMRLGTQNEIAEIILESA